MHTSILLLHTSKRGQQKKPSTRMSPGCPFNLHDLPRPRMDHRRILTLQRGERAPEPRTRAAGSARLPACKPAHMGAVPTAMHHQATTPPHPARLRCRPPCTRQPRKAKRAHRVSSTPRPLYVRLHRSGAHVPHVPTAMAIAPPNWLSRCPVGELGGVRRTTPKPEGVPCKQ